MKETIFYGYLKCINGYVNIVTPRIVSPGGQQRTFPFSNYYSPNDWSKWCIPKCIFILVMMSTMWFGNYRVINRDMWCATKVKVIRPWLNLENHGSLAADRERSTAYCYRPRSNPCFTCFLSPKLKWMERNTFILLPTILIYDKT